MGIYRKIARRMKRGNNGRITCPKCHAKLTEKIGYGKVCEMCGWWKNDIPYPQKVRADHAAD